jgi:hypothetical protein
MPQSASVRQIGRRSTTKRCLHWPVALLLTRPGKARAVGAPICAGQGSLTPQLHEAPGGRGVRWRTVAFLLA